MILGRSDVEDDASSTKINRCGDAGSLLGEISFAKLIVAWLILFIVPAVILGLAPLMFFVTCPALGQDHVAVLGFPIVS